MIKTPCPLKAGEGAGGFRSIILENLILRYKLKRKARTRPDILRVVLGPCAVCTMLPCEALEHKWGQKPKFTPKDIELLNCHYSICLKKTSNLKKIMSKSDEK